MTGAREEKCTHAPLSTSCRRQSSEPSTASLLTSIMSMPKTGANGSPGKPEPQSPLRTPKEILLAKLLPTRQPLTCSMDSALRSQGWLLPLDPATPSSTTKLASEPN